MQYQTVFDVATSGYTSWDFAAYGLAFVAISGALILLRGRVPDRWVKTASWVLPSAAAWVFVAFGLTYYEYWSMISALESGHARSVEGVVSQFKPMPSTGHANEQFCVDQVCFEYSDYGVTSGFNNASSHGGPIRDGLPVRVTYVGGHIVKLEVGRR